MARLIDADALNKKKKYTFQTVGGCFPQNEWFIKAQDLFDAPTVNAVPVVHGLWITDEKGVTYCGRCKVIDDFASVHNYCPNCGARMDGEGQ